MVYTFSPTFMAPNRNHLDAMDAVLAVPQAQVHEPLAVQIGPLVQDEATPAPAPIPVAPPVPPPLRFPVTSPILRSLFGFPALLQDNNVENA
ncbi:hypothetical protein OPQ81_011768 [Rhizoctonia solani]|nr:hypothetical protein OPQ81_011768 [Rhizoctonia solani]